MNIEVICENCAFFVGNKQDHQETGFCYRNPPAVFPHPTQSIANGPVRMGTILMRPGVRSSEWCGEFAIRNQDESKPDEPSVESPIIRPTTSE